MKIILIVLALFLALLAVYPFFNQSEQAESLTGLPWQIDVMEDGSTRVFGLHLGSSSLADASQLFGSDVELAIVAANDETGNLEMYIRSYRVGLLSGKMVLSTDTDEAKLKVWRDNAVSSDYLETGKAKKYLLAESDLANALAEPVSGITFIPSVNLDEEIVLSRFGAPDERRKVDAAEHFIYRDKGLDIALFEEGKEVLQYVKPVREQ